MNFVRKRFTYANVMSSIAVFIVLGGAAFAATQLPKNSVGTKQLKKNAVNGSKVKNGSLTGADLNLSSLGTVPSASNANHAASADNATNAANATNATNAGNANTVAGMHVAKLNYVTGANAAKSVIFSADGLTLYGECASKNLEFTATSSVDNSEIYESGNYLGTYNGGFDDNFDVGDVEEIGNEIGDASQDEVQGQLVFSTPAGAEVTAEFYLNDFASYGETSNCSVQGTVIYS